MKAITSLASAISILQAPVSDPIPDGRIHRYSSNGKRYDKAGWYVCFGDVGVIGDWRTGEKIVFCDREPLNDAEYKQLNKKVREAQLKSFQEKALKQEETAAEATVIWSKASRPVTDHPYLARKSIGIHDIRQYGCCLLIPLRDEAGKLWSLQSIAPDGFKKFMPAGRTKSLFHYIQGHTNQIGVAEGYSTAASIYEMTGHTIYVAFSAGNLEHVAVIARAMNPMATLTIWADNDQWGKKNTGKIKAEWAATISRAEIKLPDFSGLDTSGEPTDWNDYFAMKKTRIEGCGLKRTKQ